jgi:succinylarginine dihydrolase
MIKAQEINFDGLVGPTHHFGGHAFGNVASMLHKKSLSHPKAAALQGLAKMKFLHDLGLPQAILPPRLRPSLFILRKLGFTGKNTEIIEKAWRQSPALFYALSSSSSMWAANHATVSPSADTADRRVHITIANLASQFHRSIEAEETYRLFRLIFSDEATFVVHPPLPKGGDFGDEGAANHTRFCTDYGEKGVHLFVYGKSAFETTTSHFPFRQAKEASEAVARQHGLDLSNCIFARQNSAAIEAGVFHNDVISVGNQMLFLFHEQAFEEQEIVLNQLEEKIQLKKLCIPKEMLSLQEAVKSYFFNGQLLTLPDGNPFLLLPIECTRLNLEWLPIKFAYIDLTESMHNGGGPACLRLRCVLTRKEKMHVNPFIFFTDELYQSLTSWIDTFYRDTLSMADLAEPTLYQESIKAFACLTDLLHLGDFYQLE